MTTSSNMTGQPTFEVSDVGEIKLQGLTIELAGNGFRGVPMSSIQINPSQLTTVDMPTVSVQTISQQSVVSVDENQVEQILYRNENQLLRQRLEDQRKQQQQAIAQEQSRLQSEIAQLKAEAELLKQRPSVARLQNIVEIKSAHALVIGNAAYTGGGRLDNPVNDAKTMSDKLRSMGFEVKEVTNAGRDVMVRELSDFNRIAAKSDLTLLFYAGHGVQISGVNYMIPIDMKLTDVTQAPLHAVSLDMVVERYLPGKTKLVFLDACRDNAFSRGWRNNNRGLARMDAPSGTILAYATAPGKLASDGSAGDRNSPYTKNLLRAIQQPNVPVEQVFKDVRRMVVEQTKGEQVPWENSSLIGNFVFKR